jgi:hypothetical protein
MENKSLVFITPLGGASILGKIAGNVEEPICKIEEAFICERLRIQVAPGQFDLTFLGIPLDVFDQSPKTIYAKIATYFIVEKSSRLEKFYHETLTQWQLQRAGLVQATSQDLGNVHPMNKGNGT